MTAVLLTHRAVPLLPLPLMLALAFALLEALVAAASCWVLWRWFVAEPLD